MCLVIGRSNGIIVAVSDLQCPHNNNNNNNTVLIISYLVKQCERFDKYYCPTVCNDATKLLSVRRTITYLNTFFQSGLGIL